MPRSGRTAVVVDDRFTRFDEARDRHAGGTGLGLAIARELTTRLGGTLEVVADGESGAWFRLTLPATDNASARGFADRQSVPAPSGHHP